MTLIKCVHCLKYREGTLDHVLPKSYYSDQTIDLEKLKVPSCKRCNSDLSKIEEDFLTRAALTLNPYPDTKNDLASIAQRILRSMNPKISRDEKDKQARFGKAKKYISQIFKSDGSTKGMFPGFGYHAGWKPEEQYGIRIPGKIVEIISEKLIRGLEYIENNRYLDHNFNIKIYYCHEKDIPDVLVMFKKATEHEIATEFKYWRIADSHEQHINFRILVWNKWITYGYISKAGFIRKNFNRIKVLFFRYF